jgi:hypothetical protein
MASRVQRSMATTITPLAWPQPEINSVGLPWEWDVVELCLLKRGD